MNALHATKDAVNTCLRPLGVQVIRGYSGERSVQTYISARKTIAEAKRAGLAVGDYIDQTFAEPGATAATVDAMLRLSQLTGPVDRVCEIGAGSGRFLQLVAAALQPKTYEVYEPAADWARYLQTLPTVQLRESDGRTLFRTASGTIDLVHAQKVFVYLEFATTAGYLAEMARVVKPGGAIAFDIVTQSCLDENTVGRWLSDGTIFRPVPRDWVLDFLAHRGLTYAGNHIAPLPPGTSELLVFRREDR